MKRTVSRWIAAVSVFITLGTIEAARRPRYGGELRVEMSVALQNLDPSDIPAEPEAFSAKQRFVEQVFETLVRMDERGEPQPWLATSWTHDSSRKRWLFNVRSNVILHNGATWSPPGGVIEAPDDQPIEQILRELARSRNAIAIRAEDGSLVGSGPFRITRWEPGKSVTLAAHEGYWAGRPYLDSMQIQMGRVWSDQVADFELGKADVVEEQVTNLRLRGPANNRTASTFPTEVLALVFVNQRVPANVREAVALSVDRGAIQRVILQKQGEASAALLPRWLSGYAFLFGAERNVTRARQIAAAAPPLNFAYDTQSSLFRPVAQRIEVNASEAGITIRRSPGPPDLLLVKLPVTSHDPWTALQDLSALLKLPWPAASPDPYQAERALLDGFRVIPIVHLPQIWRLNPHVRNWPSLADVWLDARERP